MRKMILLFVSLALIGCGRNTPSAQPTSNPIVAATQSVEQPALTATTQSVAAPTNEVQYPAPAYPAPSASTTEVAAPPELVQTARERLASKLGIAIDKLTIQKGEQQQWPDESIGCPAAGTTYAQIGIPGYLLTFSDGTRSYAIHTSLKAAPGEPMVWCENQQPTDLAGAVGAPTPDAQGQAMFELAKQDLAKLIQADPASIKLMSITPVEWNDSSLGCAKPGINYMQVITPGYLMRLDANGSSYEYHTDTRATVVQCMP
jgi:hypothetical protein